MDFKRVTIFTGNYGSGKTEISINYSLLLKQKYRDVTLVDLDVINPYFRSREKAQFLEKKGISVVFPKNLTYADLPVIPATVYRIIQNQEAYGVIDVGGDEEGATALGSISRKLEEKDYEVNLVINTYRDRTSDVQGIIDTAKRVEERSKLQIDNLVCNANLAKETKIEHLEKGYGIIKKAAEEMEIPLKFISVREDLASQLKSFEPGEEIFPIKVFMKPPWEI